MCYIKYLFYLLVLSSFLSCDSIPDNVQYALSKAGKNRDELEKVIDYYKKSNEPEKLKAAYYVLAGLPDQYYYTGSLVDSYRGQFKKMDSIVRTGKIINYKETWDSLELPLRENNQLKLRKIKDIEVIKSEYLINNIEEAFQTWKLPWAKDLNFDMFCEYILPYKVANEEPMYWRQYFRRRYAWAIDSLKGDNDQIKLIKLINEDLSKWFYHTNNLNASFDLSYKDLLQVKLGACKHEVEITTYAMRALGLPIALDGVPLWPNRNSRHDWNAFFSPNQTIPFQGTELNPGNYKMEVAWPGAIKSKRAKIYRTTYLYQENCLAAIETNQEIIPAIFRNTHYRDVTREYIPVSNVTSKLNLDSKGFKIIYLCVFNRLKWGPLDWARNKRGEAMFKNLGRDIVYLPMIFEENNYYPAGNAFILKIDGSVVLLKPNFEHLINVTLDKKYPQGYDYETKIFKGKKYELFYWDDEWKSLGKKEATTNFISFKKVPSGALLWLRCLNGGYSERIFTYDKSGIEWW